MRITDREIVIRATPASRPAAPSSAYPPRSFWLMTPSASSSCPKSRPSAAPERSVGRKMPHGMPRPK
eukprot:7835414-Pyramimonas_sp.AAC.1